METKTGESAWVECKQERFEKRTVKHFFSAVWEKPLKDGTLIRVQVQRIERHFPCWRAESDSNTCELRLRLIRTNKTE